MIESAVGRRHGGDDTDDVRQDPAVRIFTSRPVQYNRDGPSERTLILADLLKDRVILLDYRRQRRHRQGTCRSKLRHWERRCILHGRNVAKLEKVYDEIEALDGAAARRLPLWTWPALTAKPIMTLCGRASQRNSAGWTAWFNNAEHPRRALLHRAVRCRDVAAGHARQRDRRIRAHAGVPAAAPSSRQKMPR